MINRRTFIGLSGIVGAGLLAGCSPSGTGRPGSRPPRPIDVTKYVDPLPRPAVLEPERVVDGIPTYRITATEFTQQLHSELPDTTVWGYQGSFPGPTIEARRGTPVRIEFVNDLPSEHLLPVDKTLHGAEADKPEVRTVTHLHGGHVPPEADGWPEDWVTSGESEEVNEYPNDQRASTLWFHDHAMGITRLNVYAGLAGFYLLRDDDEDALGLPSGEFEVPIVIQDRNFNDDASLLYTTNADNDVEDSIKPEDFGTVSVVNGRLWPVLEVEPRRYRLRLLNGSNSRFYNLAFRDKATAEQNGPTLVQIGTDGGLLGQPVPIEDRLLMAPAERCDCIVDFAGFEGREFIVHTDAKTPYKSADQESDEVTLEEVMLIRVLEAATAEDTTPTPEELAVAMKPIERLDPASAAVTRELALLEGEDDSKRLHLLLDGKLWGDPISEKPKLGTTEIWRIINPTEDVHPIHLHLVSFQILGRTPFDAEEYLSAREESEEGGPVAIEQFITGEAERPDANEDGWKDTVRANAGYITDIIANFDIKGRYVWHCHILEHEDHEMMRPFEVVE